MKSLVMIGGGLQQTRAVQLLKEDGYYVIVTDKSTTSPCFEHADESVLADGLDAETIIAYILENRERLNIVGVFTLVNLTTTASLVANACGLPGIKPAAAVAGQNKSIMKRIFQEKGIPTPDFREVRTKEQALQAFDDFGRRAFVKPATSFGAQGTRSVTNADDLIAAVENAQKFSNYQGVLIEEEVAGHFIDLNGIYYRGRFHGFGVVDSYFTTEYPSGCRISPIETYVRCPSKADRKTIKTLFDLLEQGTRALGIDFGPVGADAIMTEGGPMLIEVAPRLHGAASSLYMVPHAQGLKPVKAVADVMAGEILDLKDITPSRDIVCVNELPLWRPGRITNIEGYEEALRVPGIVHIFLHKKVGDVIEPYQNSTMIPCGMFAEGVTEDEALAALAMAKETLKVTIEAL